jgi:predicted transcriptional regulator
MTEYQKLVERFNEAKKLVAREYASTAKSLSLIEETGALNFNDAVEMKARMIAFNNTGD